MPSVGDPCWRDRGGAAVIALPFRVTLPDGSTRTDPEQWSADQQVLDACGWTRSTLTQADIDRLFPPPEPPSQLDVGYQTPQGWRLGWTPDDVALLTGLYVLSKRAEELGMEQPIVVRDTDQNAHTLSFAEFEAIMLGYGAARAELVAGGAR